MAVHGGTLKLAVLEDEFRMASVGRVASCALVGRKIRMSPQHPSVAPACDFDRLEFPSLASTTQPVNITMPRALEFAAVPAGTGQRL